MGDPPNSPLGKTLLSTSLATFLSGSDFIILAHLFIVGSPYSLNTSKIHQNVMRCLTEKFFMISIPGVLKKVHNFLQVLFNFETRHVKKLFQFDRKGLNLDFNTLFLKIEQKSTEL